MALPEIDLIKSIVFDNITIYISYIFLIFSRLISYSLKDKNLLKLHSFKIRSYSDAFFKYLQMIAILSFCCRYFIILQKSGHINVYVIIYKDKNSSEFFQYLYP